MHDVQKTYAFTPPADAKRAARQNFYATLGKQRRMTPVLSISRAIPRSAAWVTVAVLAMAIVGILVIQPILNPPMLVPGPDGNFAFLISDEPNDIGDFESLNVTISRVILHAAGSLKRLQFTPETRTVDLTRLQGEQAQEIWRGDVPAGQYSQICIYVSEVAGKLESTGQTVDGKLHGSKLHLSMPFALPAD